MANTWVEYTPLDNVDRVVKWWTTSATDGTEETDKVLVDLSALAGAPTKLAVTYLALYTDDNSNFTFEFDHTTDDVFLSVEDISTWGPVILNLRDTNGIIDPASAGGTGDVVLTTDALASGNPINIMVECRKLYS